MLQLKDIVKTYVTGELKQDALKDICISFRKNEFVSILGPSGSGKTTMLNIIGGLDRYTSGDLMINGISTKKYKDSDWDFYRNNSIGFIFQSYNLIPHQSVLANVELALTLAGVSKKERHQRAIDMLTKVGLGNHLHKKPTQMSGGQMQRVAIARALINNPDILLADEPTGALDSETSVQIMELLKEIAKDKLVIMVTHNPELAEQYSTRIIKLLDGQLISDSNPYHENEKAATPQKRKKISMSFFTALSLSFNTLRTKKGRTLLTSFAGSIGLIGIALILSISTGIQVFVNSIQRDTLSSYPISIQQSESGFTSILSAGKEIMGEYEKTQEQETETIYSNDRMFDLFNAALTGEDAENNLNAFKDWLDREMNAETAESNLKELVSTIQYQYSVDLNTYVSGKDGVYHSTEFMDALEEASGGGMMIGNIGSALTSRIGVTDLWSEMLPGTDGALISELLYEQYDVAAGRWPENANEVVMILDSNGEITDSAFYALGLMADDEVNDIMKAVTSSEEIKLEPKKVTYEEVLGTSFKVVLNCDYYVKGADGVWEDIRGNDASMEMVIENGYDLKSNDNEIVKEQLLPENENYDVLTGLPFVITEEIDPTNAYKAEQITAYFASLNNAQKAEVYTKILSTPSEEYMEQMTDVYMQNFTTRESMIEFVANVSQYSKETAEDYLADYSDEELQELLRERMETLVLEKYAEQSEAQILQIKVAAGGAEDLFDTKGNAAIAAAFDAMMTEITDETVLAAYYDTYMPSTVSGSTLKDTLAAIGSVHYDMPTNISIYAKTFEDKEAINDLINAYNESAAEEDQITYTDYVAILMSGVTTMINAVSYGLIGFVAISLIVSSIMIGIITYISVLERTREIGILRSVGASKKDISRVFNAETAIVGLASGLIGIGATILINIPISLIAKNLTGISNIAVLPYEAGIILVIISVVLTMIAGLIPSKLAAKKDPVIALRGE